MVLEAGRCTCNSILPKAVFERSTGDMAVSFAEWPPGAIPHTALPHFPASVSVGVFWFLGSPLVCPLTFLWVRKFSLNPEELWWQESRSSLCSLWFSEAAERDGRGPGIFHLSVSPDPITPSLHIGVLVVVAPGFIALVCLSLAVISVCSFLPSVFFFQLVSITLSLFPCTVPYLSPCLADCGDLSFHAVYPVSIWQASIISHSSHCHKRLEGGLG